MRKSAQGAAFKRFWDQLMGVTKDQDPIPGNTKKDSEDKLSNHGHKADRNLAPAHK